MSKKTSWIAKAWVKLLTLTLLGISVSIYYYRNNFSFLIYSALCFILFIYLGLGLTMLICPKTLRKYITILSPLVGYGYLTLVGWYFYNLGFRGCDDYYGLVLIPPTIALAVNFFSRFRNTENIFDEWRNKDFLALLIVAFFTFSVLSYASINEPYLTSTNLGNNDIASYSLNSRILKEMSKANLVGYAKQNSYLVGFLIEKSVFGAYLSTAFFSSVFQLETYQVQNIVTNVFFVFSVLLVYSIARDMFNYNKLSSLGITALYGLSPIMYYTIFNSFQSQIIATPIALAIIWLNLHMARVKERWEVIRYVLLLILFNWSFSLTYPHMLPITYAVISAIVFILSLYQRAYRKLLLWGVETVFIFFAVFLLSPSRAINIIEYLLFMKEITPLICIAVITPDMFYGFTLEKINLIPHALSLRLPLSFLLIALVAYGLVRAFHKSRMTFLLSICILGIIFIGYMMLVIPGEESQRTCGQAVFAGYKHYKLLSFFYPLLLIGSLIAFSDLRLDTKRKDLVLIGIYIIILCGNVISAFFMTTYTNNAHLTVDTNTAELSKIEANDKVESINILKVRGLWWSIMWEHNFLLKKGLYDEEATYYPKTELMGDWNLYRDHIQDPHVIRTGIITQRYSPPPEVIRINKNYSLVSNSRFFAVLGDGWHENEDEHQWTSSNISTILIYSRLNNTRIRLKAQAYPLERDNQISVYWNNMLVMDYTSNQSLSIDGLILRSGVNVLEFRSLRPPIRPRTGGDSRSLGYSFSLISLDDM